MSAAIECFDVVLPHGVTLACRAAGPLNGPRVVLLHGFPEGAFVWDETMLALAARGVRALAPNLRGYERSSAPAEVSAYRARHLVADVAALIAQDGAPLDLLVAHDWGGAVAWNLAAQQPQSMRALLIVNSPHPATFLRELRHNPAQQAASAYMNFLCRPDAATLLAADDFARLWTFFDKMPGGAPWLDAALRERYRALWRLGLDGGLNYYRASPLRPADGGAAPIDAVSFAPEDVTVHVPTTVLWGDGDTALLPALLDGLDAYVPRLDLRHVPQATHWLIHEQPKLVVDTIVGLLGPLRAGR